MPPWAETFTWDMYQTLHLQGLCGSQPETAQNMPRTLPDPFILVKPIAHLQPAVLILWGTLRRTLNTQTVGLTLRGHLMSLTRGPYPEERRTPGCCWNCPTRGKPHVPNLNNSLVTSHACARRACPKNESAAALSLHSDFPNSIAGSQFTLSPQLCNGNLPHSTRGNPTAGCKQQLHRRGAARNWRPPMNCLLACRAAVQWHDTSSGGLVMNSSTA